LSEPEREEYRAEIRSDIRLQAAAPAIRKQERERLKGAFFDRLEGAGWSQGEDIPTEAIDTAFDAAFATLEDSDA